MNSGNLVNRIGLARRQMAYAWMVTIIVTGVAIVGWTRKISPLEALVSAGVKLHIQNGCEEYAETMCNTGKDGT